MDQHTHTSVRRELQMARSMCWHCQSEVTGEYFCERCVKVQPVSKETDYFTCLGLPRRLTLDQQKLEAKFYELSRAFHPDFYQNKSETEQAISLGNAAMLNTAYRTLRDPIQRAEYLLALKPDRSKTFGLRLRPISLKRFSSFRTPWMSTGHRIVIRSRAQRLRARLQTRTDALGARKAEPWKRNCSSLFADGTPARSRRSHESGAGGTGQILKQMRDLLRTGPMSRISSTTWRNDRLKNMTYYRPSRDPRAKLRRPFISDHYFQHLAMATHCRHRSRHHQFAGRLYEGRATLRHSGPQRPDDGALRRGHDGQRPDRRGSGERTSDAQSRAYGLFRQAIHGERARRRPERIGLLSLHAH